MTTSCAGLTVTVMVVDPPFDPEVADTFRLQVPTLSPNWTGYDLVYKHGFDPAESEIELEGVVLVTVAVFTGVESTYETQALMVAMSPLEKAWEVLGEIMLTDRVDVT